MARFKMSEKAELLRRWKKSGVSMRRFAREEGIGYLTFTGWVSDARDTQNLEDNEQEMLPVVGQIFKEDRGFRGFATDWRRACGA